MVTRQPDQEWSMQEIVRITGTTSRTLRHYQQVGLLLPSRTGHGGQRFYDRDGLLRLQRILVLRELNLGLPEIARVLDDRVEAATALREHARQLEREQERLSQVLASVHATIRMIDTEGVLMATTMFDGFDHTRYQEEVVQRWGEQAYAKSDTWWRSLSDTDKQEFQRELDSLVTGYGDASARGLTADDEEVQALTARLHAWVRISWGGTAPNADAFVGLGEMYVADPRFAKTFAMAGRGFAELVRDAMTVYALEHLD